MNVLVNGVWVSVDSLTTDQALAALLPDGTGFLKKENGEWVVEEVAPGGGVELGNTSTTAHRGDHGVTAYTHSQAAHAPADAVGQAATYTDAEVAALDEAIAILLAGKAAVSHNHDLAYAAINHNHSGTYEPANANIQSHIGAAHAPSNAQKNSDITKAEIEAKLTGEITSHTHPSAGGDPFTAKLVLASDIATGANTTPVSLTGMVFTFLPASTYVIEFYMIVTSAAATTGHGFGLNCSQAPVIVALNGTTQLANTGTVAGWQAIANNAIAGVTSAVPTANTITPSFGQGVLRTHATLGGTCQFIFRSETTAATVCKAGSTITIMKVA